MRNIARFKENNVEINATTSNNEYQFAIRVGKEYGTLTLTEEQLLDFYKMINKELPLYRELEANGTE